MSGPVPPSLPGVTSRAPSNPWAPPPTSLSPDDAVQALMTGNARFVAGRVMASHRDFGGSRDAAHSPFATILACADSGVPVEVLFDQGAGALIAVDVAGNVATPDVVDSLAFGTDVLGAPVLMVLGHTDCATVTAAVTGAPRREQVTTLFEYLAPAVDASRGDIAFAIERNVRDQMHRLAQSSRLAALVREGRLRIVGGVYDHATGAVWRVSVDA